MNYYFEQVLLDIQTRAYQQYPYLKEEDTLACVISDNSLPDLPVIWVNDDFAELTKFSKEELVGRNCRFLQGPCSKRASIRKIKESLTKNEVLEIEILNYRKDGIPFWNKFKVLPIFASNNSPSDSRTSDEVVTHFISIQMEVTVMKEMGKNHREWDVLEVGTWLDSIGLGDFSKKFIDLKLDGKKILNTTSGSLRELGFSTEDMDAFENGLSELKLRAEKIMTSFSPSFNSPSSRRKSTNVSTNVLVNVLTRDKNHSFNVKRTSKLSSFQKLIKSEFKGSHQIQLTGTGRAVNEFEWLDALMSSEESLNVSIVENSKSGGSIASSPVSSFSSSDFSQVNPNPSFPRSSRSDVSSSSSSNSLDLSFSSFVLPQKSGEKRTDFDYLLNHPQFLSKYYILSDSSQLESLGTTLYNFFKAKGRTNELFHWAIRYEMENKEQNCWFKSSSLSTKIMDSLFKSNSSLRFLRLVLNPSLKRLISEHVDLEIETGDFATENMERMHGICEDFFASFLTSFNKCPLEIREGFSVMIQILCEDKPKIEAKEIASSILYQRFIAPAISNPTSLGLNLPENFSNKSVALFSKVLNQVISNEDKNVENGKNTTQIIDKLTQNHHRKVLDFMSKLGDPRMLQLLREVVDASTERDEEERVEEYTSFLDSFFSSHADKMKVKDEKEINHAEVEKLISEGVLKLI
jgi:hypothetical protein